MDIQHGAAYWPNSVSWLYQVELYDGFCTWGWTADNPYLKMTPITDVRFTDYRELKDAGINGDLLLITNDYSPKEDAVAEYRLNAEDTHFALVESLSEDMRKRLVVRLRNDGFGFSIKYRHYYPEVRVETIKDRPLTDSIEASSIIIVDHISSSLQETLLLGKIAFIYGGLKLMNMAPGFLEWIQKLKDVGVYYEEGGDLAKAINENLSGMIKKYRSQKTRETLTEFMSYFCGYGKDKEKEWYKEFMKEAD